MPRQTSPYSHHSAQAKFSFGLRNLWPHEGHLRVMSVLKNSTASPQAGQLTLKTSSGLQ